MSGTTTTAERILDSAEDLLQRRGYHAFSFRDVAARVGVRAASVHYHFATKDTLVEAVLERAQQRFEGRLQALAGGGAGPVARLTAFAALFADAQGAGDRLCPFCTVTTAQDSVPQSLRARLRRFWLAAETWLTDVLEEGYGRGLFTVPGGAAATVATLVAAFEGAMIAARATGENDRLCLVVQWLRDVLCGSAAGAVVPQRAVSVPDR